MTLDQLMDLEGISDYNVWWYGITIGEHYFDESGFSHPTITVHRGADLDDRVYVVLAGIDGKRARYKFAIRLKEDLGEKVYSWERVPLSIDQYRDRLLFRCTRNSSRPFSFYNSQQAGKDFLVESIAPPEGERTVPQFTDYDSVELTFPQLKEVIDNGYVDYYEHLSCIKAVYMIIDGNTGKQYIGSAYEQSESLWARWKNYADTCHGGNLSLKGLYEENGEDYFKKFKYIILQIFPKAVSDKEIIRAESRFKDRFLTREFGLNNN